MLRTNTTAVKEQVKEYVLNHFGEDYGWENPNRIENLKEQLKAFSYMYDDYHRGRYMAEGGTFAIYYIDQRNLLIEWLDQTDSDQDKYSNQQVFDTFCHLIGKAVEELAK